MPVDPEFEPILAMMTQRPDASDLSIEARRNMPMAPKSSVSVASVENLVIEQAEFPIEVRLYKATRAPASPVIVFYHGGGFVFGDLDTHDDLCRRLCNGTGCAVLAVHYRRAPEHKFPAAPEDALTALRWTHDNAHGLDVDAARIVVAGDSAGANLAAATALRCRDEGGPALRGQVLFCPVVEFYREDRPSFRRNADGPLLTKDSIAFCTAQYLRGRDDADHPYAAPICAGSLRGLPPALVITAEFDPLCDEGEAYATRMAEEGVQVQVTRYDGAIHDFMAMPGTRLGERALQETFAWVHRRIG